MVVTQPFWYLSLLCVILPGLVFHLIGGLPLLALYEIAIYFL
jgi:hypothetical protein